MRVARAVWCCGESYGEGVVDAWSLEPTLLLVGTQLEHLRDTLWVKLGHVAKTKQLELSRNGYPECKPLP